ncbi:MAG TPA: response regulator [Vicinamibacterales bacterium]|nr:response regulator [Vicinamibacterales bacterium]
MPKTLLLADDSITIQRVVELTFAGQDVTVVAVGDGNRAIESISQAVPDLVLADIGMPGRSGYEVAEYVRSQPQLASLPVLLLAGAFEAVDQAQAHRVGADGILTKPFDPAVLVGRVNELLAAGRRPSSPVDGSLPPARSETTAPPSDSDQYFEQIDQAFAALAKAPRPPVSEQDSPPLENEAPTPSVPMATPVALTDAFAALLDAERAGSTEIPAALLPRAADVPVAGPIDVNALADRIVRRVLEQLSDRVLRDTVADIVSTSAERLVREEIDRIKRNIK